IRWPSAMPAGMSTVTLRATRSRPVPRQLSHGSLTMLPRPRQTLQVLVRMNWPKPPRLETSRMRPLPWHCGQLSRAGTGRESCPQCHGSGRMREVSSLGGFGQFIRTSTCNVCRGRGSIVKEPCESCRGTGRLRVARSVTVDIPAGIADGQRIRYTGDGGAGAQGGRSGDLYVAVVVEPHESLVRDGDDLIYRQDVTMIEAALGTTAYVPALDGDIEMELPPGTQPGQTKVYRNRGVPVLQGLGRGDLKVVVNVLVPRQLSDEQREVLEQFAALTADTDYEPDQGFLDKVRAVFRQ